MPSEISDERLTELINSLIRKIQYEALLNGEKIEDTIKKDSLNADIIRALFEYQHLRSGKK